MATSEGIHKKKLDFLEKREAALKRKVSTAERKLLDVIIEKFIDELEVSGGQIKSNVGNIKLTQALDRIFEDFDNILNKNIIKSYITDMEGLKSFNKTYFGTFERNKKTLENLSSSSAAQINRRLGITPNGGVVGGGFLDNFIKDSRLRTEFTELVTKGISGGVSFKDMKNDIKLFIVGGESSLGSLQKNYSTFIYDTYQQIDRLESGIYAQAIGMDSFIYSGGKVRDTRKFCCQRNGKVWTVKEAKSWKSLKFQGKTKNYNPLIDLGGYNCRHSTQYISNVLAAKKRSDLKLDKNGNLVKDSKGSNQKLNKC